MLEVQGKGCVSARVIADSMTLSGRRITTYELEYPRFVHGEFMTHRVFSRNAMSSRAVPIEKMIEQVRTNPAMPIHWGKNQKGMQANEVLTYWELEEAQTEWRLAAKSAAHHAEVLNALGGHKQIVNRILEPFQIMKTVMTSTEMDNFFYLRCHGDAQPEIRELADCMYGCWENSEPEILNPGEWHTPYVEHGKSEFGGGLIYTVRTGSGDYEVLSVETALKVSASCCAQVSYRLLDNSVSKAINIYDRLVESKPVHASPFEHQATPMRYDTVDGFIGGIGLFPERGQTHVDKQGNYWSGNLQGWVQHRQLIKGHVCNDYPEV